MVQYQYKKMKSNLALNTNPYIDEVAANPEANSAAFVKKASLDPRPDTIEEAKAASATENAEEFERDIEDLVEGDIEAEIEREKHDEFTSHHPYKDRHGGGGQQQQQQQQKQRKLGKVKRKEAPEPTREEVFSFLTKLDQLLDSASRATEADDVDKEFKEWNNWFKPEKKAPPAPDSSKVFYIREEYNTKRSPHLWKSNPDRKWVLAFGNDEINNVVSTNLYKYQNETISKDA